MFSSFLFCITAQHSLKISLFLRPNMLKFFFFGVDNQYVYSTFIFIFPNKPSTWNCSCHSFCFCNVVNEKKIHYETDLSIRNWLDVEKSPLNLQNNGTARGEFEFALDCHVASFHIWGFSTWKLKVKFICWSIFTYLSGNAYYLLLYNKFWFYIISTIPFPKLSILRLFSAQELLMCLF